MYSHPIIRRDFLICEQLNQFSGEFLVRVLQNSDLSCVAKHQNCSLDHPVLKLVSVAIVMVTC